MGLGVFRRPPPLAALPAIIFTVLAGCDRNRDLGEGPLLPVSGKIVFDGKPLTEGAVAFYPDVAKGNASRHLPRGGVAASGVYAVSTTTRPGLVAGWYRITVVASRNGVPPPAAANAMEPGTPWPVSILPDRYGDPGRSGLSVEVVSTPSPGAYDLVLTK